MDVSTFLKSHFGEDGSLARVLQELGDRFYHNVMLCQIREKKDMGLSIPRFIFGDIKRQTPETQRKIAELLGWRE